MTTAANGSSSEIEDIWANAKTPGNFGEYGMSSVRTPGHYDPYSSPGAYLAVTEDQGQHDENAMDEDLIDNDPPDNSNINVTTPAWFGGSPVAGIDNGDNAAYSREAIYEQMELERNANHMHAARTPTYITARTPRVPFTSQDESTHGFHNNSYGDPYGSATKNYDHDDGSSLMDASLITHSGQTRKFKTTARSRHVPACANDYGTDPDSLTAELGSVSAATGTIPPLSFSPRKLPSSHPAANMPSNGMHIPEMLPAPSSSSFGTPPGKPAGRGRGAKKQMPGVPKKIKKAPARRSAAAKALLADDEDEDDDDDDNDGIVNMDEEETPSSKKKGKGKGQGKGRKSTAVPKTPKERIRKPPKNGITPTKPIPRSFDECDEADRMMIEMRDEGKEWREIRRAYAALDGSQHGTSTLPNRYERLKTNFVLVRAEDNALIVEVKRDVEDKFAVEKWGLIAEAVEGRGGGGGAYDGITLQRQYKKLMEQQGFNVSDGLARNDVDFATEHDGLNHHRVHRMQDGGEEQDDDNNNDEEGGGDDNNINNNIKNNNGNVDERYGYQRHAGEGEG